MFVRALIGLVAVLGGPDFVLEPPTDEPKVSVSEAEPTALVAPSQVEIAEKMERAYRDLKGLMQFNYLAEYQDFPGEGEKPYVIKPVRGKIIMGKINEKYVFHSDFFQDGRHAMVFALAPDGILREWGADDGFKESRAPFAHGTNNPILQFECVYSCYFSFVGVPSWESLDLTQKKEVADRLFTAVDVDGHLKGIIDGLDRTLDLAGKIYKGVDKASHWRTIIEKGERQEALEKAALAEGEDCQVWKKIEGGDENRWNMLYVDNKTSFVTRFVSRKPNSLTTRYYTNIQILDAPPAGMDWKPHVDSKNTVNQDKEGG